MIRITCCIAVAAAIFTLACSAQAADTSTQGDSPPQFAIELGAPFCDNMVLQREMAVPIWGWSEQGTQITIEFAGQKKTATAAADSAWKISLDPLKASFDPTQMVITESTGKEVSFNRDIRPILATNCFACHGLDEDAREAELRLDDRTSAIDAEAITPGKPDESELIARIESDDPETKMPPPDSGHELSAEQIKLLRRWITQGAGYQQHWSFTPPVKVAPSGNTTGRVSSPDRSIHCPATSFRKAHAKPAGRTLAVASSRFSRSDGSAAVGRRSGQRLLPTNQRDAYEKAVDRLLGSEAYGEHWARMWLDLAQVRGHQRL